jgi:hypothetical protein
MPQPQFLIYFAESTTKNMYNMIINLVEFPKKFGDKFW